MDINEFHQMLGMAGQQVWHDMQMMDKEDPSYDTLNKLGLLLSYLYKATISGNNTVVRPKAGKSYTTPHKEFFNFIYYRLKDTYGENPDIDFMRSLRERIDDLF